MTIYRRRASFVAVLTIGAMFATVEASARSAGFGGSRRAGFHSGSPRFVAPPVARIAPLPKHIDPRRVVAHRRVVKFGPDLRRRFGHHNVGSGIIFYGSADDLAIGAAPYETSSDVSPPDPTLLTGEDNGAGAFRKARASRSRVVFQSAMKVQWRSSSEPHDLFGIGTPPNSTAPSCKACAAPMLSRHEKDPSTGKLGSWSELSDQHRRWDVARLPTKRTPSTGACSTGYLRLTNSTTVSLGRITNQQPVSAANVRAFSRASTSGSPGGNSLPYSS